MKNYEISKRPLTPDEIFELKKMAKGPRLPWEEQVLAVLAPVVLSLGLGLFLTQKIGFLGEYKNTLLSCFLVLGGLLGWRFRSWAISTSSFVEQSLKKTKQDLENGIAEILVLRPLEVARLKEQTTDLGDSYLLKISEEEVVFMAGQELELEEEEKKFPSPVIEIISAPLSGNILDYRFSGEYLPPSKNISEKAKGHSKFIRDAFERRLPINKPIKARWEDIA